MLPCAVGLGDISTNRGSRLEDKAGKRVACNRLRTRNLTSTTAAAPLAGPATSIGDRSLSELFIEISGIRANHARQCGRKQRHLSVGAFFALHQGFTMF